MKYSIEIGRTVNGKDIIILGERDGATVRLSCAALGHLTRRWTPHPRAGRTRAELDAELAEAVDAFASELAAHDETRAHLDDLFKDEP